MTFHRTLGALPLGELAAVAGSAPEAAVERALSVETLDLFDFAALLSPAASPRLEEMAVQSAALTTRRFGRTVQLYAPLYVSNECVETCTYCAFSIGNPTSATRGPRRISPNDSRKEMNVRCTLKLRATSSCVAPASRSARISSSAS